MFYGCSPPDLISVNVKSLTKMQDAKVLVPVCSVGLREQDADFPFDLDMEHSKNILEIKARSVTKKKRYDFYVRFLGGRSNRT